MNKKEIYFYDGYHSDIRRWEADLSPYPLASVIGLARMLQGITSDRGQDKTIHPQTYITNELARLGLDEAIDAEELWYMLIYPPVVHGFFIEEFIPGKVYDGAKGSAYARLGITSKCDDAPHLLMINHFTIKAEESYIAPRNHRELLNFIKS